MVEIKKTSIPKFLGPLTEGHLDVKVSLFVVSDTDSRLTRLDLGKLTSKERAAKLREFAEQSRFVAVIEMGDMVFAHAHAKYAAQLQGMTDLTLDGRKMTVKTLSDDESAQLSAIGEAFEKHVMNKDEEISQAAGNKDHDLASQTMPRQYHARTRLVSDQTNPTQFLIQQMFQRDLGKIITECMRKYSEEQRELQKIHEAEDRRSDIQRTVIKRDILRDDVKTDEIKRQELKHTIIDEDAQHFDQTRGIED